MRIMQIISWALLLLVGGYILLNFLLYISQSSMMYHPFKDIYQTPQALGLSYEEVRFRSGDGPVIAGWYVPAKSAKGTVLFSHGNAGNISGRLETLRILHTLDLNVLMYDYRGYGNSEGSSTEETTYLDAMAAWDFLTNQKEIPASEIILMGRSLGGAVSAWLAANTKPAALILESTFTSAKDLAAELYPIFPVRMLMKFDYPTLKYLRTISVPLLVSHSTNDGLVPFHHGKELFNAAGEPKSFLKMRGEHGSSHVVTGEEYIRELDTFVNSVYSKKIKQSE